jgi:ABC-type transporter Mla MlaB component
MALRAPQTVAFTVTGPIARDDLPGLCGRICALLAAHRGALVVCEVAGVRPNAVTVDALARLQLAAQRHGCRIRLTGASDELLDLVAFIGLRDVLLE